MNLSHSSDFCNKRVCNVTLIALFDFFISNYFTLYLTSSDKISRLKDYSIESYSKNKICHVTECDVTNTFIANIWRMTQIHNLAQAFSLTPPKYASFELYMNIVWIWWVFLQSMFCTGRNSAEGIPLNSSLYQLVMNTLQRQFL